MTEPGIPHRTFRDLISGRDYAGGWILGPRGLRHSGSNGLWVADLRIDIAAHQVAAFVTNSASLGAFIAAGAHGRAGSGGRWASCSAR